MTQRLESGDVQFRKAYLSALIERVEVEPDYIRIVGQKTFLNKWLPRAAKALRCSQSCTQLAHLDGQTSNQLLDTLAEWNEELEAHLPVLEPIL